MHFMKQIFYLWQKLSDIFGTQYASQFPCVPEYADQRGLFEEDDFQNFGLHFLNDQLVD